MLKRFLHSLTGKISELPEEYAKIPAFAPYLEEVGPDAKPKVKFKPETVAENKARRTAETEKTSDAPEKKVSDA